MNATCVNNSLENLAMQLSLNQLHMSKI